MTRRCDVIRYVTEADYERFFNEKPRNTMRAVLGERDGKIVGMGGVIHEPVPKAFMDLREPVSPRDLIKAVNLIMTDMKSRYRILCAVVGNEPTAKRFLEHYGFEYYRTGDTGEVYLWLMQQ